MEKNYYFFTKEGEGHEGFKAENDLALLVLNTKQRADRNAEGI